MERNSKRHGKCILKEDTEIVQRPKDEEDVDVSEKADIEQDDEKDPEARHSGPSVCRQDRSSEIEGGRQRARSQVCGCLTNRA